MENVNFAQLFAFAIARAWVGDLFAKLVKAGVDLSLPLTLPSIRLLSTVPENNQHDLEENILIMHLTLT